MTSRMVCVASCPALQDGFTDDRCEIRRSSMPGAGRGLFARSSIPAGSLVCSYSGECMFTVPSGARTSHVVYCPGRFGYIDGHSLAACLPNGTLAGRHVGAACMANSSKSPNCKRVDLTWNAFQRRTGQGDKLSAAASSLYTVIVLETTHDISAGTELTWDYREASSVAVNKGRGWHETRISDAARL